MLTLYDKQTLGQVSDLVLGDTKISTCTVHVKAIANVETAKRK